MRPHHRLTGADLPALAPGLRADGRGLYLRVDWSGARRWALIFYRNRRRHERGLGGLRRVTLTEARQAAEALMGSAGR